MIQILLGELLGNPKGTKSFSSWSEFTDFVNEMPIKTIQPFVSNFNAFAGEGFYGNVVQGLVIKQLEDNVFLFGIAIDGTLIFRNRNYPDVSTWKDPKIIIHSNNWHKIYSKPDLGELIGINETWFRDRGNIRGKINLDDFKNAGAYSLFNVEGNNIPTSWAQLLIFSSGYYITQIIVDISSRKLFIRRYDIENDRWQEWGNIIMT